MKNQNVFRLKRSFAFFISVIVFAALHGQGSEPEPQKKPGIAVVDFDCSGYNINELQVNQYVLNELIRVGKYEVLDRYEIAYVAQRDSLTATGCFSKPCLLDFGHRLHVDYMFTGDIIKLGEQTNISLRMLNVKNGTFEKMIVKEFLVVPGSELTMIRISINEFFGLPNDEDLVKKLTQKADFDNTINNPYRLKLRSDGPRMGFVFLTGTNATILQDKKSNGGFEGGYPAMFQFGYQFEKQYLNEGNYQALFEFIPNITGFDQGRFIPSFTLLNGLRNNHSGWEFAIGPNLTLTKMAQGFYDPDGHWHLAADQSLFPNANLNITSRADSRGEPTLVTGLLIGFGKTFRSGRMNIPVNGFFIPAKNGARFGISFGWNSHERYESVK